MKIAICEDNSVYSDILKGHIYMWATEKRCFAEISIYKSAEQFLIEVDNIMCIDLVLLDIRMGEMDGVELAHKLRDEGFLGQIIFTTDYAEYVWEGYKVSALDFLMKPVDYSSCAVLLDKVQNTIREQKYYICQTSEMTVRIPYEEILYFEANLHYIIVNTIKNQYITRSSLSEVVQTIDADLFVQCHRSFLVNISHVSSFSQKNVTMSNEMKIDVGRKYLGLIREKFTKHNIDKR